MSAIGTVAYVLAVLQMIAPNDRASFEMDQQLIVDQDKVVAAIADRLVGVARLS